jgi:catechol 2,3-dioxygenase-like lactoylglutathione lyase family enzyme
MRQIPNIKILFIAGFGPVVSDAPASRKLYQQVLGIPFKEEQGGYLHTDAVPGAKHFALWPLAHAAQSIFGSEKWPADVPTPQGWVEFDVEDIESATAALESQGYKLLVKNKTEPWGQTVTRFLSPEGLLMGITVTPSMREKE